MERQCLSAIAVILCYNPIHQVNSNLSLQEKMLVAKSRTEQLVERLRDLQASSGDVEAAAIVSVDGLSMASSLPGISKKIV